MPEPPESWVWLAQIRRPQGRKGEVFAEILTDFPGKFATRRQLWLLSPEKSPGAPGLDSETSESTPLRPGVPGLDSETWETKNPKPPRPIELTAHWLHKGGIVLHFAGVDSISTAEPLKGMVVAIPRAERAELTGDETFISDLVGCVLVDVSGAKTQTIGEIEDVDRTAGPAPLLVVRGSAGEVLVPFTKSYLRRINLAAKRVEMSLPEGLADLNSTKHN